MASVEVEDRDLGFKKLQQELAWLRDKSVTIGWQGESALESPTETDATMVDIATFQEFGTEMHGQQHIVPRPMVRHTFDTKQGEIEDFIEKQVGSIYDGKRGAREALNRIGLKGVSLLQAEIRNSPSWAAPNKPSTIAKKTTSVGVGDVPLIDSGRMLASSTFAIRDADRIIEQSKAG